MTNTVGYRYPVLDGARGVAALGVLLYHTDHLFGVDLFRSGFLAVDLFFLMSGLVVARAYDAQLQSGDLTFFPFLKVRAIRLLPLYYAAVLISLFYQLAKIQMGVTDAPSLMAIASALPATLVLLPDLGGQHLGFGMFPFAPSAWSLSLEFWFNLVYALLLPVLFARNIAIVAVLSGIILILESLRLNSIDLGWQVENLPGGMARFCFSFSIGVLIFRQNVSWTVRPAVLGVISLLALACVLLPPDMVLVHFLWVGLVFPVFIITARQAIVGKSLGWLCDHAGRLSYAIYILHIPVLLSVQGAFKVIFGADAGATGLAVGTAAIAGTLGASMVLTYFFDEPLRRALSRPKMPARHSESPQSGI